MANNNLTRKKSKTFDYYGLLKEYYIEGIFATIPVKVNGIDDIISRYSVNNYEILNNDFIEYIDINANNIPRGYKLILEIYGSKFNEEEKKIINKAIHNYYSLIYVNKKEELKNFTLKGLYLLLIGILCFIIYFVFFSLNFYPATIEIFSFLFCLFLWNSFDIVFLSTPNLKSEIKDLEELINMDIEYKD